MLFQLFLLEETRERKFDSYARLIQKAFKKHFSRQKLMKQKEEAAGYTISMFQLTYFCFTDIFYKKKERRTHSLNRNFYTDYIGLEHKWEQRRVWTYQTVNHV